MFLDHEYEILVQKPDGGSWSVPFVEATWSGSRQEAKRTLAFKMNEGRDRFWQNAGMEEGDLVQLISRAYGDTKTLFTGIVVDLGKDSKGYISPVAYDFGFYLLNNDISVLWPGGPADQLLRKIYTVAGVDLAPVGAMPNVDKQVIRGKSIWDATTDILNQVYKLNGTRYWCWLEGFKAFIGQQRGQTVQYRIAQGGSLLEASRKRSIGGLRNVVRVVGGDKDSNSLVLELEDKDSAFRYGRMVKVIEVQDKEKGSASMIARQTLDTLRKVKDEASLTSLGFDDVIAGNKVEVYEEITGLTGIYTVFADSHTIRPSYHEMKIQLQMDDSA